MKVSVEKKYEEVVDFPVEIIGKDGVVRKYSFEESVLLYQRRIRLVRLRYSDEMEIQREVQHCSNRIAQLRRSYFTRYGWDSFELIGTHPQQFSIELGAELAAFFRNKFGGGKPSEPVRLDCLFESSVHFNDDPQEDEIQTTPSIETSRSWIFSVTLGGWMGMLYITLDPEQLDAWVKQISSNSSVATLSESFQNLDGDLDAEGSERIVFTSDNSDVYILLTSISGAMPSFDLGSKLEREEVCPGLQALADGNLVMALALFVEAFETNPYDKQAYWAGSIVANQLRLYEQEFMILQQAAAYFPEERSLKFRRWSSQIRLNRNVDEVLMAEIQREQSLLPLLIVVEDCRGGRYTDAYKRMGTLLKESSTNKMQMLTINWFTQFIRQRMLTTRTVLISALLWISLSLWLHPFFSLLLAGTIVLYWWMDRYYRNRLESALLGKLYTPLMLENMNDVYFLHRNFDEVH